MRIDGAIEQIPNRDLRSVAQLNAFFIVPAGARSWLTGVFSTHPPLEKRLAALDRLETQLQGTTRP